MNHNPNYYIGRDQWGKYFNFTGNESPDTCFWCGTQTRMRYCVGTTCRSNYVKRFWWKEARKQCLREARVGGKYHYDPVVKCYDCGIIGYASKIRGEWWTPYIWRGDNGRGTFYKYMEEEGITNFKGFQIHHIIPLQSEDRSWHWLNQWLVCLCSKCHILRHKQLDYLSERNETAQSLALSEACDPQLSFIFVKGIGNV